MLHLSALLALLIGDSWGINVRLKDGDAELECLKSVECIKKYFEV